KSGSASAGLRPRPELKPIPPSVYVADSGRSRKVINLTLVDAFARFGAKLSNRQRALSALAEDGSLGINSSYAHFAHPRREGVLRYEDKLSRNTGSEKDTGLLGQHLTLAREGALPVRMVVTSTAVEQNRARSFYIRSDLVGTVVEFDGDHFII